MTVEASFRISVRALKKFGYLSSERFGLIYCGTSSVNVSSFLTDQIELRWLVKGDSDWNSQSIKLERFKHPRHLGGFQTYLICPCCLRACNTVYLPHGTFACRVCHKLSYGSQREQKYWRIRRKVSKIAEKLGWEFQWGETEPYGPPKGMHRRTYDRLSKRFSNAVRMLYYLEGIIDSAITARCMKHL